MEKRVENEGFQRMDTPSVLVLLVHESRHGYFCASMDSEKAGVARRPRFLTVFSLAENVHLAKDVGMIPQYMSTVGGYSSILLCQDDGQDLPYSRELTPQVELVRVALSPGYVFGERPDPAILAKIKSLAPSIDVLQLFHLTKETMLLALAYKLRKPFGKVYIKLDASTEELEPWNVFGSRISMRQRLLTLATHAFMLFVPSLVTAETMPTCKSARRFFPQLGKRLRLVPNGVDDLWLSRNGLDAVRPSDKRNVILVVGRIGSFQKNHEMILDALGDFSILGEWSLVFVGPIEDSFRDRLDKIASTFPESASRLIFTGPISDRAILYDWYAKAKIFCLTSRYESFCLALVDALHFGCHIVSTPVISLADLTNDHSFGQQIANADELRQALLAVISGKTDPLSDFSAVREHSKTFRWSAIAASLAAFLKT